ncbi:MAG TPA: class II aldolase/adducin family protein [archaeon]|nr:class II aldolase/adducin family protein [archaeon]
MQTKELVDACGKIGSRPDLVQAGGGNISIKDKSRMLIKASGITLADVSEKGGIADVDFNKVSAFLKSASENSSIANEKNYTEIIGKSTKGNEVASMETGFHSVLGNSVVHTHSVLINSVSCAQNSQNIAKDALGNADFEWVGYKTPGVELSVAVFEKERKRKSGVFILENHGLIVSCNKMGESVQKTIELDGIAGRYLQSRGVALYLPQNLKVEGKTGGIYFIEGLANLKNGFSDYMFPDCAVYCNFSGENQNIEIVNDSKIKILEKSGEKRNKVLEVFLAHLCVLLNIEQYGRPKFLTKNNVNELRGMESESFRKGV